MTAQDIINRFQTQVDDATELSTDQELDLLNQKYFDVCNDRPWEFLKVGYSNSVNGTSIALPANFSYICSQNIIEEIPNKIVWVDNTYYPVVTFDDRYLYENRGVYVWVDLGASTLNFSTAVSGTLRYDYIKFPTTLTLADSPIFPAQYHAVLYHLMAVDDYFIQQFDKAKSYAPENQAMADNIMSKLRYWDSQAKLNV